MLIFVDFFSIDYAVFRLVMTSFPRRNAKLEVDRDIMKRQAGFFTRLQLPRSYQKLLECKFSIWVRWSNFEIIQGGDSLAEP